MSKAFSSLFRKTGLFRTTGKTTISGWRDSAHKRMVEDERFAALGEIPFDGKRMVFSGFITEFDSAEERA